MKSGKQGEAKWGGREEGPRARFMKGNISQLFVYFTVLLFSCRSLQGGKEAVGAWELKKIWKERVTRRKKFIGAGGTVVMGVMVKTYVADEEDIEDVWKCLPPTPTNYKRERALAFVYEVKKCMYVRRGSFDLTESCWLDALVKLLRRNGSPLCRILKPHEKIK